MWTAISSAALFVCGEASTVILKVEGHSCFTDLEMDRRHVTGCPTRTGGQRTVPLGPMSLETCLWSEGWGKDPEDTMDIPQETQGSSSGHVSSGDSMWTLLVTSSASGHVTRAVLT